MQRRDFIATAGQVAGSSVIAGSSAQGAPATAPLLDLQWLGGATMLIRFDGLTLLTDPAFGTGDAAFSMLDPNAPIDPATGPLDVPHRRLVPLPAIDIAGIDALLLSHEHPDHFDQTAQRDLPKHLPILAPAGAMPVLVAAGFGRVQTMRWSATHHMPTANGSLTITALPADHSPDPSVSGHLGDGNGYWLSAQAGNWRRTIYWTGDTFPTPRVLCAVRDMGQPDLMIAHVGGVGIGGAFGQISMAAADLATMAAAIQPGRILPVHHTTFSLFREPAWQVLRHFEASNVPIDLIAAGGRLSLG